MRRLPQLVLLGILALASGVAVRLVTAPAPAVATSADLPEETEARGDGRPRWEVLWTRPAPDLAALGLSADGQTVAWVDGKGRVRCMDAGGRTLWQTGTLPGVNRVVATPKGQVLAYAYLNPVRSALYILTGMEKKRPPQTVPVEGAIWDVTLSSDGSRAAVGTGERYVYLLPLSFADPTTQKPPARWRTPGIPGSVAVAVADEPLVVTGTWQQAGVYAFAPDGAQRWPYNEPDPARQYEVCLSGDGSLAVAVSGKGPREADARLHVWDADSGKLLWMDDLEAFHPRALTTRRGRFVAVTYVRTFSYDSGSAVERKLALYDQRGRRLWEKGGLFFSPELVAFSASGSRLTVTDGINTLYTLDARGKILSRLRLPVSGKPDAPPATIREVIATESGDYLLVRRGDGQISLLKAT